MNFVTELRRIGQAALVATAISSLALYGCSTGVLANLPGSTAVTGNATVTQTTITDGPNEQVLALGLTIQSIRLFDSAGKYADVLTTPTTIEASHLDAVQEPLRAALNIPQDTYTSALITVSDPKVVYVDPTTKKPVQATATLTSASDMVTFTTPITVTGTSAGLCFDLLVGQSVALTGTAAAVTPTFDVRQIPYSKNPTNGNNGRLDDIFGSFVSGTGTSLTVATANGSQVVIATDANTTFQGFAGVSALTVGELLDVDVAQQTNGTLLAVRIHIAPSRLANELVGPVTATTGKPATSFTLTARQWLGAGTTGTTAGTSFTVAITGATTFSVGLRPGALPTLPFTPLFNANTLSAGQNVAVEASAVSGTTATAAAAAAITLVPQTVGGSVTAISQAGGFQVYTVALPSGSALGSLTGATTVMVYANGSTQFMNSGTIAVGSTVRFNGLLFNDGGTLRLLSGACSDQQKDAPPQKH